MARLLDSLREAGAHEQAAALAGRLPAAGMFGLFLEQKGFADQFRFGREADGTPAAPWGWEDLDLWLVLRPRAQAAPGGTVSFAVFTGGTSKQGWREEYPCLAADTAVVLVKCIESPQENRLQFTCL